MSLEYVVRWSDEDDCFIAKCTSFPFVAAHGKTEDEAVFELKVASEAIFDMLHSAADRGERDF